MPITSLIINDGTCSNCGSRVGVRPLYQAVFLLVTVPVAALSTAAVWLQQGVYAALLWFPFPVATIGYLKARYSPLRVRPVP